jgi:DNA repair protein RadC
MYTSIQTQLMKVKEASNNLIRTPEQTSKQCQDIADLSQEAFQIITLNSKNMMIDRHLITLGILNASLVHPREVFRPCIQDSAAALILIHNHPSGDITPSAEDIRITKKMIEAGNIIDIKPLDHVIVAKKDGKVQHLSMREEGICQF